MTTSRILIGSSLVAVMLVTSGCGSLGGNGERKPVRTKTNDEILADLQAEEGGARPNGTIWDIFKKREDPGRVGAVNRYLWNASLDVLDFLPVQTVDPFSGVITTGYGTPPGGGRAYRATILISDPALDARSLNLALHTRSGPVDPATVRAIEDAILTRARQLRKQDSKF
ncbi:DUF3576 domain-containing protein [Mameliella sediminis]|uniref:DUF3576 domain-containing protein n=1 Tax=Mameliella sediminis TaxID=2836866 RepID=UPI001C480414|nr:DUF3576 domain-containing protein [Mameliella sediminis]MBY6113068.1 DUF3576 domain-containing protein [Antarctobacter heliothermus]MBY6143584.1 DUF3576 domain-containing protein [Mameliella alba]MBV7394351.1 DUF3576 domain-containing protein [Mameliella sediminis]MBY6162664.1 DUF3576 domain-containing protein [Mameliella alba]MBY6172311.1 DUF3576 domain-containing protein [Mameliella alba]